MGKQFAGIAVAGIVALASTAGAALDHQLLGTSSLEGLTDAILAECPGAGQLAFEPGTAADVAAAIRAGQQELAPMGRLPTPAEVCGTTNPDQAQSALVALDAVTLYTDGQHASCPGMEVRSNVCFQVEEHNGETGLQCPGCEPDGHTYCFGSEVLSPGTAWRDAVRIVYGGMTHDAGSDLARQDCNSDVRHSLSDQWLSLLSGECLPGTCAGLARAWRPADDDEATRVFLELVGLAGFPFCNGTDSEDVDPVRRACGPNDVVCELDGTMGLVVPVRVPKVDTPHPRQACQRGRFALGQAWLVSTGPRVYQCPETPAGFNIGTNCLAPTTEPATCTPDPGGYDPACPGGGTNCVVDQFTGIYQCRRGQFDCLSSRTNRNAYMSSGQDGRVFNRYLRESSGSLALEAGQPVVASYYRSSACGESRSILQAACLATDTPCSLGLGNREGLARVADAKVVALNGVEPTDLDVRRVLAKPADPLRYPLAFPLYVNTLDGFGNLSDPEEDALRSCYLAESTATSAASATGLVGLGGPPRCIDFNETRCNTITCQTDSDCAAGELGMCIAGYCKFACAAAADCSGGRECVGGTCSYESNDNSCATSVEFTIRVDVCPVITSVIVAPLTAPVGGTIGVSASATDADGDDLTYAWTADAGTFVAPNASLTTHTCETVGTHAITISVFDGVCVKSNTVDITCTPPS